VINVASSPIFSLKSWMISRIKGHSFSRGEPASGPVYGRRFAAAPVRAMELITILNRCHRFRGFVYQQAHFSADNKKSIEVAVRPRKGSAAVA
jgi:hypothetical protein